MNEARKIRDECEKKIKELQDACPHTESEWLPYMFAPGHFFGSVRSCKRCDKILEWPATEVAEQQWPILNKSIEIKKD